MKLSAPLALALALTAASASAQTFTDPANLRGERPRPSDGRELPVDKGASGLQQLLRKLNTRASLMLIVAHPDDEDGGMLTLYSRGLGARVAMLTLNRGEGGQNAMTGDFEDALGLLRTQELLAADRYFNVDQMFGTEVDFGFSKTKEEAFAKWTHDRVLYDAVRAVRIYRPLVIAAVFIGGVTDGHGQHQVSGQIAQEVFNAAGDPKVFPELTAEGILPWQPLKVYARVPMQSITAQGLFDYATGQYTPARFTNYVTGEVTTTQPSVDVVVHEGTPDPLLEGKSYVQFARIGLGLQRSQIGPGVRNASAGAYDVSYHLYGSKLGPAQTLSSRPERAPLPLSSTPNLDPGFFDGIDTSIEGVATLAGPDASPSLVPTLQHLAEQLSNLSTNFNPARPTDLAPHIAEALSSISRLITNLERLVPSATARAVVQQELNIKRTQLNDALALSLGITFDATTGNRRQVVASRPVITAQLSSIDPDPLTVQREWLQNSGGSIFESDTQKNRDMVVASGRRFARTMTSTSELTFAASRPYFDRDSIETPFYHLRIPALRNAPATPPALTAWATVLFRGVPVTVGRVVHEGNQPLTLTPEASINLDRHAQVILPGTTSLSMQAHMAITAPTEGTMRLRLPAGWGAHPTTQPLTVANPTFTLSFPAPTGGHPQTITTEADTKLGNHIAEGFREIGYGDLPITNFFTPSKLRIVPVDLKLPTRTRIAYLPGTGDSIPDALTSINLAPTILTLADLTPATLAKYDTVILGVRTYNAHPELHGAPTQALFDYARNGGNVIVQFQTAEFTAADAPFPLTLGRAEVVIDETTPVQLLEPTSPLLRMPNKITPADFNNWVEERGHGFLRTWDPRYTALTETHDPGQAPQLGGLITTQLGKGRWTYCAFALYRQLPEAIPGAFRLFANLLNP